MLERRLEEGQVFASYLLHTPSGNFSPHPDLGERVASDRLDNSWMFRNTILRSLEHVGETIARRDSMSFSFSARESYSLQRYQGALMR